MTNLKALNKAYLDEISGWLMLGTQRKGEILRDFLAFEEGRFDTASAEVGGYAPIVSLLPQAIRQNRATFGQHPLHPLFSYAQVSGNFFNGSSDASVSSGLVNAVHSISQGHMPTPDHAAHFAGREYLMTLLQLRQFYEKVAETAMNGPYDVKDTHAASIVMAEALKSGFPTMDDAEQFLRMRIPLEVEVLKESQKMGAELSLDPSILRNVDIAVLGSAYAEMYQPMLDECYALHHSK